MFGSKDSVTDYRVGGIIKTAIGPVLLFCGPDDRSSIYGPHISNFWIELGSFEIKITTLQMLNY